MYESGNRARHLRACVVQRVQDLRPHPWDAGLAVAERIKPWGLWGCDMGKRRGDQQGLVLRGIASG